VAQGLTAIEIDFVICANGVSLGSNQPEPRGATQFLNPDVPVRCWQRMAAYRNAGVIEKRHVGNFRDHDVKISLNDSP
jgi:hypothetical protein